jgi:hypothetical protein
MSLCQRRVGRLGYKTKARGLADPGSDSSIPLFGAFEVLQVLFEGRFVKLVEERGGYRGIVPANLFDQLTFVHVSYTFKIRRLKGRMFGSHSDRLFGRWDLRSVRRK